MKSVLPQLVQNKDQLEKLIENGKEQLSKKGIEINSFKELHNIKIKGSQDMAVPEGAEKAAGKSNVLVS